MGDINIKKKHKSFFSAAFLDSPLPVCLFSIVSPVKMNDYLGKLTFFFGTKKENTNYET